MKREEAEEQIMAESAPEQKTVREVLEALLEGIDDMIVRVRQDGKMDFLPLAEVKDQRQVYKVVMALMKRIALRNGWGRRVK